MKIALAILLLVALLVLGTMLLGRKDDALPRNPSEPDCCAGTTNAARDNAVTNETSTKLDPTDQAPPQSPPAVPPVAVRVGGSTQLDACGSSGRVANFTKAGNNFLSVRAAPDARALETDRLKAGADVHLCDSAHGEDWLGVIYAVGGKLSADCGVSSPIAREQAYAGSCRTGWVSRKYVQLLAG